MNEKRKKNRYAGKHSLFKRWHKYMFALAVYDVIIVNISYFVALWLRFDCRYTEIPAEYMNAWLRFAPWYSVICLVVFYLLGLYQAIWRFASFVELSHLLGATGITGFIHTIVITTIFHRMPVSYYVIGIVLQFLTTLGIRFSYKLVLLFISMNQKLNEKRNRVMIIGAGRAGQAICRELNLTSADQSSDRAICMIDDDQAKWGRYIEGIPVAGGRESILSACQEKSIDKIFFCIPTAKPEEKRDILNICKETGCELKTLPGLYQLASGEAVLREMKEVEVVDLLGREPIKVDLEEIYNYISGKTILITGGGGSIGSELCRQVAKHGVGHLIIFEIYENNAYAIQQELLRAYPDLNLDVEIGSVRDTRRVNYIFRKYKPDVVYHAAAHKHVPLMEYSPCEAIKNNTIGTYKTAYAAMMNGTRRFVMISTDKAVNPTNVMGASKRMCEMIIQSFDKKIKAGAEKDLPILHAHMEDEDGSMVKGIMDQTAYESCSSVKESRSRNTSGKSSYLSVLQKKLFPVAPDKVRRDEDGNPIFTIPGQDDEGHRKAQTEFVAVRFGNVLGSNGSVIPLFKKQIAEGGPVTVTDKDIIRYFMTIPEAVSLVLQAGVHAHGGEIFVLDMGEPVKIDDLARNLIKLSGFKPDVDIKIEYTGLRPGEKLYEEKLMAEEGIQKTANDLIYIGKPIAFDEDKFLDSLQPLMEAAYSNDPDIRTMVHEIVNTYRMA